MFLFVRRFLLLLLITVAAAAVGEANYPQALGEGILRIELGQYDSAAKTLERMLERDEADYLSKVALATVYLHTGRLDDAEREYTTALAIRDDWRVHYALAILDILRKRSPEAHLADARKSYDSRHALADLDFYLSFINGVTSDPDENKGTLEKQAAAIQALKAGDNERAIALICDVLRSPVPPGFEEKRAPVATFDPKKPISLPGGHLTWKPSQPKAPPTISGIVTLKADASQSSGVYFVMLYVDDEFVAVTNFEPYQFDWNTANVANGLHEIRLDGKNQSGGVVSSKTIVARVSNERSLKQPPSGPEIDLLSQRLWNCIRLTESRKLMHHKLAQLYLGQGNNTAAIRELEYVVAYEPDYQDALKQLNEIRGRRAQYSEVSHGRPGSKRIALTFDDGPNERTAELLEMLARLDVKATFFVVGFRAEAQPELIKAILAAGHQVESHTYSHPNLTKLSAREIEGELAKTSAVLSSITGKESVYFRPPGGHLNEAGKKAAARHGLTGVFWTVNCSPYEGSNHHALADHVIKNATDGGIVLMHNGEPATTSSLPVIVRSLRNQGYTFVTIAQLLDR